MPAKSNDRRKKYEKYEDKKEEKDGEEGEDGEDGDEEGEEEERFGMTMNKRQTTVFSKEMKKRQFQMFDRQKASKPRRMDSDDYKSPRSEDSFEIVPSTSTQVNPQPATPIQTDRSAGVKIQIDSVDDDRQSLSDPELNHLNDNDEDFLMTSLAPSSVLATRASSANEDDVKSQLSFIMKEKLHTLAKEVHRRTSAIREDLIRETPEDSISLASNAPKKDQASLMSLVGIQKVDEGASEDQYSYRICGKVVKSTFHQYGLAYKIWLVIVSFAFLFNAFCIPLRSSYPYQDENNRNYWFIVDYTCDIIYLIDMILVKPRLRYTRGGIQVKNPKETRNHYLLTTTFKSDLLSIIPTDISYLFYHKTPLCRINRVFKIGSFWTLFDMLDNSTSNPYAIRIARTLSYMIYIIHCNSCVYYKLSAWQAFGQIAYLENGKWYLNKWVYNNQGNAYIRCFYFTAAVATSTGNNPAPTNVIEYIYMTCSWMMGVFVFALLLGQIRDIVSNANRNREEFQRKMDLALSECENLGLTKDLKERVRMWFIFTWQQQKTLDEKKLIEKLPLKLQTDLALSVHYSTLSKVKLFQDCDRALLRDLVLKLRPVIYLPQDWICKKGDVGKEMYIVNQGVLEVVVGDEGFMKTVATIDQGNVFGEISLLAIGGNNRRTASIRAKGYTTLFVLAKDDLNDVIRYYPQAQAILKKKAAQMLRNDKKTSDENEKVKEKIDMENKCRLTIGTPRMVKVVTDILPEKMKTKRELMNLMVQEDIRRPSLYHPWSVLQVNDDDKWMGEDEYESICTTSEEEEEEGVEEGGDGGGGEDEDEELGDIMMDVDQTNEQEEEETNEQIIERKKND